MTPHVQLKSDARIKTIMPAGIRILAAIDRTAQLLDSILTITSASEDRGREATDPHMTGEAFDVSVRDIPTERIRMMYRSLKHLLGAEFTVLLECPSWAIPADLKDLIYVNDKATGLHLHIQRKRGTIWPPPTNN